MVELLPLLWNFIISNAYRDIVEYFNNKHSETLTLRLFFRVLNKMERLLDMNGERRRWITMEYLILVNKTRSCICFIV